MSECTLLAVLDGHFVASQAPNGLSFVPEGPQTAVIRTGRPRRFALPLTRRQAVLAAADRQACLEQLMLLGTVFPVRDGCLIHPEHLPALLRANASVFDQLRPRLAGVAQYQVTLRWNPAGVLEQFRDTAEIAPLFACRTVSTAMVRSAVGRLRTRLIGDIWRQLEEVTKEILRLPAPEDHLVNAALLVEATDIPALDRALEAIDSVWTDGFAIRLIGPSPAVSFALLDPIWHDPPAIRAAFKDLGLLPGAMKEDITLARRIALKKPGCNIGQIRQAAHLLQAAADAGTTDTGLYICEIRSEDHSPPTPKKAAVA